MGETSIEWTDRTWNPVTGCTKVSQGCKNCYAERVFPRAYSQLCTCGHAQSVHRYIAIADYPCDVHDCNCVCFKQRAFTDVRVHDYRLDQPLRWRKPQRVFVNSMSDLFHEDVSFEFIDKVFAVMALAPQHTFQVLTKRPERMREYFADVGYRQEMIGIEAEHVSGLDRFVYPAEPWRDTPINPRWTLPLPNVWLGVSVEDQKTADERIPLLLQTPAALRFISYEPAIGPLDMRAKCPPYYAAHLRSDRIGWVIIGGESGPGARPFNIQWARDVIAQCKAAGVPVFMKQLGARPMRQFDRSIDPISMLAEGEDESKVQLEEVLADRKGGDPAEWPEDLRVREWPLATG